MSRAPREEARDSSREAEGRSKRVPLGVARSKLSVPVRPGYQRRWVNDAEGRIANAEAGGYTFALDPSLQIGQADIDNENRDLGARVSRVVDKTTGQKAYLMEIKEEFYKEDQNAKVREVEKVDQRIKKGKLEQVDDGYVPDQGRGIKYDMNKTPPG
jgi:hypothetical protein